MEERKIYRDLEKLISEYCKENNLKMSDPHVKRAVRELNIEHSLLGSEVEDNYFGLDYGKPDQDYRDLVKLHEKMVQDCIDFVNSHYWAKKLIEKKKAEIMKEWNKDLPENLHTEPDLRIYFGVDGLDESVTEGNWVPSTDSYLGIYVGNKSVIESM